MLVFCFYHTVSGQNKQDLLILIFPIPSSSTPKFEILLSLTIFYMKVVKISKVINFITWLYCCRCWRILQPMWSWLVILSLVLLACVVFSVLFYNKLMIFMYNEFSALFVVVWTVIWARKECLNCLIAPYTSF